ncbi:MAG: hypothetical protein MSIBF_06915 [Candidatus Altiarchaeales archaeon IMC4]|nr:MAG: hypothetical protein MSIBF_06915 [Candidatus Altiarchaeales archaeon IMC4]
MSGLVLKKEGANSDYDKYLLKDEKPVSEYIIGMYRVIATNSRIICLRKFPKTFIPIRYKNVMNMEHYTHIDWRGLVYAVLFLGVSYYASVPGYAAGFILGVFGFITSVIPEMSESLSEIDAASLALVLIPVLAVFGLFYTFTFLKSLIGSLRISTDTGHIVKITTPFTSKVEELIKTVEEYSKKPPEKKASEGETNAIRVEKERLDAELNRIKDVEERLKFDQDALNKRRMELEKEEEGMELLFEEEKKAKKKKSVEELLKSIASGYTYLIKENNPDMTFKIFMHYIKKGYSGLCITRTNPTRVKEKYNLMSTEVYWLTDTVTEEFSVAPNKLEEISVIILEFISGNEKSIILIDGLEYLITKNDYRRTLHFVQHTRDNVSTKDSMLLVPIRPAAVEKKELEILEREVEVIEA